MAAGAVEAAGAATLAVERGLGAVVVTRAEINRTTSVLNAKSSITTRQSAAATSNAMSARNMGNMHRIAATKGRLRKSISPKPVKMTSQRSSCLCLEEALAMVILNEVNVVPKLRTGDGGHKHSDVWYLDNGASNHMTGDYSMFHELRENYRSSKFRRRLHGSD